MSHFESIELLPADPIMNLPILFAADKHPHKVNLGIGSYKDDAGKAVVLKAVSQAEELLLKKSLNKEYPPIEGNQDYISSTLKLIFGEELLKQIQERIFAQQTVGGTSALRVAGDFFSRNITQQIYLPEPTWANHHLIYRYANMKLNSYPYYDPKTHGIDFQGICNAISQMEKGSLLLLHASCHNPTGRDPSNEQWQELSSLIKKQQVIPLFDLAYQGFGQSVDADSYPVRLFAEEGHQMFIASSYAKNFGLYGERVGLLAAVFRDKTIMEKARSHLKQIARSSYSVPPLHGGRIVAEILNNPSLKLLWEQELAQMRHRIQSMRQQLVKGLSKSNIDMHYMTEQLGMFSYTDLNGSQVERLKQEFGIYLAGSGRANIAGLNQSNIQYVIDSMAAVIK